MSVTHTTPFPSQNEAIRLHLQWSWELVSTDMVPVPRADFADAITVLRHDIGSRDTWDDDDAQETAQDGWNDLAPVAEALHGLFDSYMHYRLRPTDGDLAAGTIPVPFSRLEHVVNALGHKLAAYDDGCVPEEGVYRRIARETGVLGRIAVVMDTYERQVIRGEHDAATPTPTATEGSAAPDDGATA